MKTITLAAASCFFLISHSIYAEPVVEAASQEVKYEDVQTHLVSAAELMQAEAKRLNIQGAAVVAYVKGAESGEWQTAVRTVGNWIEAPKQEGARGANLVAIAYAKAAEALRTKKNSGASGAPPLIGENGWMGAAIEEFNGGYVIAAFSGGPSKIDLEVSKKGISFFKELMKAE